MSRLITFFTFISLGLIANISANAESTPHADDDDPILPYSYSAEDPGKAAVETVPGLIIWAEAELAEHQGEGLYKDLAVDEANTQAMIALAKEFEARGKLLVENGDSDKALAQFLAAEAIARYAAEMPHLLEARVHEDHDHHH